MKTAIKPDALFILDGSYFLYRSFYALPPLYNSTGKPTNATYAFCRTLKKFIQEYDPQKIVVVWDSKGGSFRNEVFTEYKATRQAPPNDLFVQKEDIQRFIKMIGMCSIAQEGYEADDLIASLVAQHKDGQAVIISADKDMAQLLGPQVLIIDPFKDRIIDAQTYEQEKGLSPSKVSFFYALLGDSSDNIPGVTGIGNKTALDLIKQFESLDDLYAHLDKVEKPRIRKLLEEQKQNAYLSLQLFTLQPIKLTVLDQDLVFDKHTWVQARDFFAELEFKSLIKDLEKNAPIVQQQGIFGQHGTVQTTPHDQQYALWKCHVVSTEHELDALVKILEASPLVALDTETTGIIPLVDHLVGLSFAYDATQAYYIPLAHPYDERFPQLPVAYVVNKLKPLLESTTIKKVLHHAKFDELVLWHVGITLQNVVFDTLIAANVVKVAWQKINLKDLSFFYLHEPMRKFKEVMGNKYKIFSEVPVADAAEYGAHDALQTFKLHSVFEQKLEEDQQLKTFFETIEMPLYHVLVLMEKKGIMLDSEVLKRVGVKVDRDLKHIEEKIFAALPEYQVRIDEEPLNLNSPKQIEVLLFDRLHLPEIKKSKKGSRSTDHEVLLELSKIHPVPGLLLKYRELAKLKSTYIEPLPMAVNPQTGRIHTNYSQTMTATGRLASSNPNLQNIPTSAGYGMQVREAFIAPPGHLFLSADYSQIELRILAHMSGDKRLLEIFLHDQDIHLQTASHLFQVPLDQVTSEQRQLGKRINFSIIYGLTPFGLSKELGIKPNEAKEYIDKFFAHYQGVAEWIKSAISEAQERGYAQSLWGMRRAIPELKEKNRTRYELGTRLAVNSPIQSTQADIIKLAMISLTKRFKEQGVRAAIILQIHDELVFELPEQELSLVKNIVLKEMEGVVSWAVPLKVTMREGKNWAESTK